MRKLYEAPSVDVVKFEAQDIITVSGAFDKEEVPGGENTDRVGSSDVAS